MPIASFLFAAFQALAALPSLISTMEALASQIMVWYIQRQKGDTLQAITNAASLQARAVTDADRYKASDAWAAILKRSRISQ